MRLLQRSMSMTGKLTQIKREAYNSAVFLLGKHG